MSFKPSSLVKKTGKSSDNFIEVLISAGSNCLDQRVAASFMVQEINLWRLTSSLNFFAFLKRKERSRDFSKGKTA